MTGGSAGADLRIQLGTLSGVGVVGDLSDGQLIRRFLDARDGAEQAAFTALVERHGPMVLRVCRHSLGDPHDAQDAFQATFLVLARKAGTVRKTDSLASWLHGVALRIALRARADAARRSKYERRGAALRAEEPGRVAGPYESWPDLHEEVARLPHRYREPVVLCYLEGLTTEAAASRIGCPRGTVLSRLSRARERLRGRLSRRGLALTALPAVGPTPSALPAALIGATVRSALGFAGRRATEAALASATATTLAREVLYAMTVSKMKALGVAALGCAFALGGVQTYARQFGGIGAGKNPAGVAPPAGGNPTRPVHAAIAQQSNTKAGNTNPTESDKVRTNKVAVPDGLNFLKARLDTKRAELKREEAQRELASSVVKIHKRLNERIKGSVSKEEGAKAEAELKVAQAAVLIKEAEIREIEVRISQALVQQSLPPDPNDTPPGEPDPILRKLEMQYSDLESRLKNVEQKLDRILKAIEGRNPPPS